MNVVEESTLQLTDHVHHCQYVLLYVLQSVILNHQPVDDHQRLHVVLMTDRSSQTSSGCRVAVATKRRRRLHTVELSRLTSWPQVTEWTSASLLRLDTVELLRLTSCRQVTQWTSASLLSHHFAIYCTTSSWWSVSLRALGKCDPLWGQAGGEPQNSKCI